jgi:hypothetical protein
VPVPDAPAEVDLVAPVPGVLPLVSVDAPLLAAVPDDIDPPGEVDDDEDDVPVVGDGDEGLVVDEGEVDCDAAGGDGDVELDEEVAPGAVALSALSPHADISAPALAATTKMSSRFMIRSSHVFRGPLATGS